MMMIRMRWIRPMIGSCLGYLDFQTSKPLNKGNWKPNKKKIRNCFTGTLYGKLQRMDLWDWNCRNLKNWARNGGGKPSGAIGERWRVMPRAGIGGRTTKQQQWKNIRFKPSWKCCKTMVFRKRSKWCGVILPGWLIPASICSTIMTKAYQLPVDIIYNLHMYRVNLPKTAFRVNLP